MVSLNMCLSYVTSLGALGFEVAARFVGKMCGPQTSACVLTDEVRGFTTIFPISDSCIYITDRLCDLVVRVSGYRYRGPGFDPRRYQIF